jgi:hypothetical protein
MSPSWNGISSNLVFVFVFVFFFLIICFATRKKEKEKKHLHTHDLGRNMSGAKASSMSRGCVVEERVSLCFVFSRHEKDLSSSLAHSPLSYEKLVFGEVPPESISSIFCEFVGKRNTRKISQIL